MKFKKLASLLIAGAMVLSMAMPVFAVELGNSGTTTTTTTTTTPTTTTNTGSDSDLSRSLQFTGRTSVPTISVDMITDAQIVLNPYGLKVTIDGEEKTDPFLTETVVITNKSDCPIWLSGSFTPVVTGDIKLAATAAAADTGKDNALADKNVFVTVVMGHVTKEDSKIDFATSVTGADYRAKVKAATAAAKYGSDWLAAASGGKTAYYPLPTADTAVNFGDANDNQSGKVPYVLGTGNDNPTYFAVRLFGLCEKYTKTAWTAGDTVSVNMAVTIAPASN